MPRANSVGSTFSSTTPRNTTGFSSAPAFRDAGGVTALAALAEAASVEAVASPVATPRNDITARSVVPGRGHRRELQMISDARDQPHTEQITWPKGRIRHHNRLGICGFLENAVIVEMTE